MWDFGASLAQPIFTSGKLRSNVRLAQAQKQASMLFYQQTIQGAVRSVSDALIAYHKTREFRAQLELPRTLRVFPTCAIREASRVVSRF